MSFIKSLGFLAVTFIALTSIATAEVIYHKKWYPKGDGPFPAVIVLHTAGGFKRIGHLPQRYTNAGYAVYAPDYYTKYGIKARTRMTGFKERREEIQKDLEKLVSLIKKDPNVQKENVFAAGYSAGGFFVCFLAHKKLINSGVSLYGVWRANYGDNDYPVAYFKKDMSPVLALHGEEDATQKLRFLEEAQDPINDAEGRLTTHLYPNADHGWDRRNSKLYEYNEEVDKDSTQRTLAFFEKYLKK